MPGGAGIVGVAEDVAGAVDARPLAVPEAEDAIEFAFAAQFRLLGAPERSGGQILVEAGLEADVIGGEELPGLAELLVEPAQRRTAIASDVAGRIEGRPAGRVPSASRRGGPAPACPRRKRAPARDRICRRGRPASAHGTPPPGATGSGLLGGRAVLEPQVALDSQADMSAGQRQFRCLEALRKRNCRKSRLGAFWRIAPENGCGAGADVGWGSRPRGRPAPSASRAFPGSRRGSSVTWSTKAASRPSNSQLSRLSICSVGGTTRMVVMPRRWGTSRLRARSSNMAARVGSTPWARRKRR